MKTKTTKRRKLKPSGQQKNKKTAANNKFKTPPVLGRKPMASPGPYYYGAMIHWLTPTGRLRHTDNFPTKKQLMTNAQYLKLYGKKAK